MTLHHFICRSLRRLPSQALMPFFIGSMLTTCAPITPPPSLPSPVSIPGMPSSSSSPSSMPISKIPMPRRGPPRPPRKFLGKRPKARRVSPMLPASSTLRLENYRHQRQEARRAALEEEFGPIPQLGRTEFGGML